MPAAAAAAASGAVVISPVMAKPHRRRNGGSNVVILRMLYVFDSSLYLCQTFVHSFVPLARSLPHPLTETTFILP